MQVRTIGVTNMRAAPTSPLIPVVTLLFGLRMLAPVPAAAWGDAFTAVAYEVALGQSRAREDLLALTGGAAAEPVLNAMDPRSGLAPEEEAAAAVDALALAFAAGDGAETGSALAHLVAMATDLWQPLDAAGELDPPGAAAGFHFRYESVLSAQVVAGATPADREARVVTDVTSLAGRIAAERRAAVPALVRAEKRALAQSGGLYDETYFACLRADLGADLARALDGAAATTADLIETAWVRSGRGAPSPPAGLLVRILHRTAGASEVELTIAAPERVEIALHDAAGRRVAGLAARHLPAGRHRFALDLERSPRLASGIFFVRVRAGEATAAAKLMILR